MVAIATAMLHFDHTDRMWHVFSTDAVREQTNCGRVMHLPNHTGVRLLPLRIPAWGHMFSALRSAPHINRHSPDTHTQQLDTTEHARCQKVYDHLTARQKDVLKEFARGLLLQDIADTLSIAASTVHSHKTRIFEECRIAWEFELDKPLDHRWLREKFAHFL